MVSDAEEGSGGSTTKYLDLFVTNNLTNWKFSSYLTDSYPYKKDWRDVATKDGNQAWAVGTDSLVARVKQDELTEITSFGSDVDDLGNVEFTGVMFLGDLLVLSGTRVTETWGLGTHTRTVTHIILTHRGNKLDKDWVLHTLDSETINCGFSCDSALTDENLLMESGAHGEDGYVVGRGWGSPGALPPQPDDQVEMGLIYHIHVPGLQ